MYNTLHQILCYIYPQPPRAHHHFPPRLIQPCTESLVHAYLHGRIYNTSQYVYCTALDTFDVPSRPFLPAVPSRSSNPNATSLSRKQVQVVLVRHQNTWRQQYTRELANQSKGCTHTRRSGGFAEDACTRMNTLFPTCKNTRSDFDLSPIGERLHHQIGK